MGEEARVLFVVMFCHLQISKKKTRGKEKAGTRMKESFSGLIDLVSIRSFVRSVSVNKE